MDIKIRDAAGRTRLNVPIGSIHFRYVVNFSSELNKEGVKHRLYLCFNWDYPEFYIENFGGIKLVTKTSGIDQSDREVGKSFIKKTKLKCLLISFGTTSAYPKFEYIFPAPSS